MVALTPPMPLLETCDRQLTVDDWLAMPESPDRYELHDGMLVMAPPPDGRHQGILTYLVEAFGRVRRKQGGMTLVSPMALILDTLHGYQPDLVYVSAESRGTWTIRGVEGAPDIVVEILSPSTRRYDLKTKLPVYLESGVGEVWIIDPASRTVAVHRADEAPETVAFGRKIPSRIVKIKDGGLGDMREPRP